MGYKKGVAYDRLGNPVAIRTTADQVVTKKDGTRTLDQELIEIGSQFSATLTEAKTYTDTKLSEIGDILVFKGKVDTVEDLPSENNKHGDMWLVGLDADEKKAEYFWSSADEWELFGYTKDIDLTNYYTKVEVNTKLDEKATLIVTGDSEYTF